MPFIEKSAEVLYVDDVPCILYQQDLRLLKKNAESSPRQQSRLCTHTNESSNLHEMMMFYTDKVYVRPHKQEKKTVSYHIMRGEVCLFLFDDKGAIKQVCKLGEFSSGLPFYFRAPANIYRAMLVLSKELFFHEVTQGPFCREDTLFAPWAPDETEIDKIENYLITLKRKIGLC